MQPGENNSRAFSFKYPVEHQAYIPIRISVIDLLF